MSSIKGADLDVSRVRYLVMKQFTPKFYILKIKSNQVVEPRTHQFVIWFEPSWLNQHQTGSTVVDLAGFNFFFNFF